MSFGLAEVGARVRKLRLIRGLGQVEFAALLGIATGSVSKIENGRMVADPELVQRMAKALDCQPQFLQSSGEPVVVSRPWLRAYADAPKRAVDRQLAEVSIVAEVIERLGLKTVPDSLPICDSDCSDPDAIEDWADEVRSLADIDPDAPVGNTIRAVERLGCVVLPMSEELGRHLGMSVRSDLRPFMCVSRGLTDAFGNPAGDRQRFTVAHELGHLVLHGAHAAPQSAIDANRIERQAHHFAGAFLAPADPLLEDLRSEGGRVTLRALSELKAHWGVSIKALVMRFQGLGVIDADHARSLHKQISARGWNKAEPVPVGAEKAIWFEKAIRRRFSHDDDVFGAAASAVGLGRFYVEEWSRWETRSADIIDLATAKPRHVQESVDSLGRSNEYLR